MSPAAMPCTVRATTSAAVAVALIVAGGAGTQVCRAGTDVRRHV